MHRIAILAATSLLATAAIAQNSTAPAGNTTAPAQPRSGFGANDTDGNGTLSLAEFTTMMSARTPPPSAAAINAGFERIDTDRNGQITADEARAFQAAQRAAQAAPAAPAPSPTANQQ